MAIEKEYVCVECGKRFMATQPAKYCSRYCKVLKRNHATATFECVVCHKTFIGTVRQKPKFCSQQCVCQARKEILENPDSPLAAYMKVNPEKKVYTRVCINCGKHFETLSSKNENRQCPECMKTYSKRWSEQRKEWLERSSRMTEQELDAFIEAQKVIVPEVSFSNEAKHDAQSPVPLESHCQTREEINARRRRVYAKKKALGMLPSVGPKTKERNALIDERGAVCEICGYNYDSDALQIHHIDMDRQHNSPDNLAVICSNCHSILHQRVKRNLPTYVNKTEGVINELNKLKAELKVRNEAGTPDGAIRTEGCEQLQSGATRSGASQEDMNHQEAVQESGDRT